MSHTGVYTSFSSGKGGVGKTSVAANLAILSARSGQKTVIVDADWNLGKLGIVLGVRPHLTLDQVLEGKVELREALFPVEENLWLLGAPSGKAGFEEVDEAVRNQLFFELSTLSKDFDRIFLDQSSGVQLSVLQFAAASHQQVIVTTPEPTSYTDAYAIMKLLSRRFAIREFHLLVTQCSELSVARTTMEKFVQVTQSHLEVKVSTIAFLPYEKGMSEAIRSQTPFVLRHPHHAFSYRLRGVFSAIEKLSVAQSPGLQFQYSTLSIAEVER